jgi:hypothetical protein
MKDEILKWLSKKIEREDVEKTSGDFFAPRFALCRKAAFKEMLNFIENLRDEDDESIDEILRGLIKDSDIIEVTCCLDMIAQEKDSHIVMFNRTGVRQYPV